MTLRPHSVLWIPVLAAVVLLALARCDTVEPVAAADLVVEAFFDAEKPLPTVTLRQTLPMFEPYPDDSTSAAADATVTLRMAGEQVRYRPVAGMPGRYAPEAAFAGWRVPAGAAFDFEARWRTRRARGTGTVPPTIVIDSIRVEVPDAPVRAVLLDSLDLGGRAGSSVEQGYIYPVEVTLWWAVAAPASGEGRDYWIHTRLRPFTPFSSAVVDFFLRPEQVLLEGEIPRDAAGRRHWTGVYALPVDGPADPLPAHRLEVALVRGGRDYARFAASRDAPERREPVSNVEGGIGIVAGVSVDSLQVRVALPEDDG